MGYMAYQFPPEAEDDQLSEKRSSQQLLLLLLLLLILLFVYLYYFTGVIRPRPQTGQPQPAPPSQVVKKPLPPRPAEKGAHGAAAEKSAAKEGTAPAAAPEERKTATPAKPAAPAAKAAQGAVSQQKAGERHEVAPPAPQGRGEHAAGVKEARPVIERTPAVKSAMPKRTEKPAPKSAAAERKGTVAKGAAAGKERAGEESAPAVKAVRAAKATAAPAAGRYALEIDKDLAESEMGPVMAKLRQAGLSRVVKSKAHKGEPMHRLFLADFASHDEAQEELVRLKLAAPGAFMLKENGRYAVYAGSYLREGKAAVEQDRLYEKGVKLLLKTATAPVAVVKLRAGSFPDQASAQRTSARLKRQGIATKVVKLGK
jgi:hypothetical protein